MSHSSLTVRNLYDRTYHAFRFEHGDQAAFEARLLVQYALKLSAEAFVLQLDQQINALHLAHYEHMLQRRLRHEPLSRILGTREFWGHSFKITSATLDPRADSETLIDAVLATYPDRASPWYFLDLGTGTGCLLITLLLEYPNAQGWALDISQDALDVATQNARSLGVSARFHAVLGSWEEDMHRFLQAPYDVVISNPPYIPQHHIASLSPAVRDYDPHQALDGGDDGFKAYRALSLSLPSLCHDDTFVFLEIGYDQRESVLALFSEPVWINHETQKDLAGQDRVVFFKKDNSVAF